MLEKYRQKRFEKHLMRKLSGLNRVVVNKSFDDCTSFLLLFDATSEDRYNEFSRIQSHLQLQGKTVYAVGYHGMPTLPLYCLPSLNVLILGKNDLSKIGIPTQNGIDEMIHRNVDVMIDLTKCMIPAMRWISALSVAKLRMGVASQQCAFMYDITIESDRLHQQDDIMKMSIQYLNMLKNRPI